MITRHSITRERSEGSFYFCVLLINCVLFWNKKFQAGNYLYSNTSLQYFLCLKISENVHSSSGAIGSSSLLGCTLKQQSYRRKDEFLHQSLKWRFKYVKNLSPSVLLLIGAKHWGTSQGLGSSTVKWVGLPSSPQILRICDIIVGQLLFSTNFYYLSETQA